MLTRVLNSPSGSSSNRLFVVFFIFSQLLVRVYRLKSVSRQFFFMVCSHFLPYLAKTRTGFVVSQESSTKGFSFSRAFPVASAPAPFARQWQARVDKSRRDRSQIRSMVCLSSFCLLVYWLGRQICHFVISRNKAKASAAMANAHSIPMLRLSIIKTAMRSSFLRFRFRFVFMVVYSQIQYLQCFARLSGLFPHFQVPRQGQAISHGLGVQFRKL